MTKKRSQLFSSRVSLTKTLTLVLLCVVFSAQSALAGGLIRDAEIESTIRSIANPIAHAAGVDPESLNIFVVEEDSINAYVAGGANIFIHTGLLMEAETPEMLAGVIAHEMGHVAGRHLALGAEKLEQAQIGAVLSYVLGAVAVAAGGSQAGAAVIAAGSHAATRNILSFTRAHEQMADQAALNYLDATKLSADGMLRMFEKLRRNEHQSFGDIDPYSLTHPLSKERIAHITHHHSTSTAKLPETLPKPIQINYARLRAKLQGFLDPTERTLMAYPNSDKTFVARYARSIAWYKYPDLEKSQKEIDALLVTAPRDAFIHELKGQILFEHGRIQESVLSYAKAVEYLPTNENATGAALVRAGYGQALLAHYKKLQKPNILKRAIVQLERASVDEKHYSLIWRLLAEAYGNQGNKGKMHLAMAERAALDDDMKKARNESKRALDMLPKHTPAHLRANDLYLSAIRDIAKAEDD